MHTIEIPEAKIKRHIPSELSECTPAEYIEMCALIFRFLCGEITYEELRYHAVYKLMNMKPVDDAILPEDEETKLTNIYRLSELIDGFFDIDAENQKVIKQNFIHNPVPAFKPRLRTYHGPSDLFMNVGFGEYSDALRLFYEFNSCGDTELLYHIAAILYRPKKQFHFIKKRMTSYDGDLRQEYNPNLIEARVKALKYAPYGFVYGVYLFFASFQKFISSAEVPWGGKKLDFSILFTPDENADIVDIGKDDIGMDAVMFSMAESGVFGNRKELDKTNVWMILVRMYDIRVKDLKLKKQQEDAEHNTTK